MTGRTLNSRTYERRLAQSAGVLNVNKDLDQISDFKSVSIRGAFNYGRARVLWKHGLLKVFGLNGATLEIMSEKPVRKRGYLAAWAVQTGKGEIVLRGKCMTCGGRKWWAVYYKSANELWGAT